jgi:hypothetical protein
MVAQDIQKRVYLGANSTVLLLNFTFTPDFAELLYVHHSFHTEFSDPILILRISK